MKIRFIPILAFWMAISLSSGAQAMASLKDLPDTLNRIDADGLKTGHWVENQTEFTWRGEYLGGKKVKAWTAYFSNNNIYKVDYYENGLKNGISLMFDRKCNSCANRLATVAEASPGAKVLPGT